MEAHLELLVQQVASQEDNLLKTAAPNLRALENLKMVRDKFQESIDGEAELGSGRMGCWGLVPGQVHSPPGITLFLLEHVFFCCHRPSMLNH